LKSRRRHAIVGGLTLASGILTLALAQQQPDRPIELGIEERVDVDFVLVDFIVLDADDRIVSDLEIGDFKLKVGGRKTEIANLDRSCRPGAAGGESGQDPASPAPSALGAAAEPPRLVLVFDYDHIEDAAEVFNRVQQMLTERTTGAEQHMLVSFSELVRIEAPFTTDLDQLRWALRRMRNDRDLYARHSARMSELRFFERMHALLDLLERWPGRKNVVLFSGAFARDVFVYDKQIRELSALATATRTAVYPVDTAGLRTLLDPSMPLLGGPEELRRLAVETGGRMTSETNDIGVAYSQAQQDLGCVYTLGFYDSKLRLDDDRSLSIKIVGHPELRVVSPRAYVVRSDEQKRSSMLDTATLAPHVFESDGIRAELFVTGAGSGDWRGIVGVEIRLDPGATEASAGGWELRGSLRKPNGTIVQSFARTVSIADSGDRGPLAARTFEELAVPPGDYALSVVFSNPRGEPMASTESIRLPAVPARGAFLLGPILGRGGEQRFEPLMSEQIEIGEPLHALTVLCVSGSDAAEGGASLRRWVADLDGRELAHFEDASVELRGSGLRCGETVQALETGQLEPGRYRVGAAATIGDWVLDERTAEFGVRRPDETGTGAE